MAVLWGLFTRFRNLGTNPDNPTKRGDYTEEQNKKERIKMKTKTKDNRKVPKSTKTRLSDLTPNKDARGGYIAPTPPYNPPRAATIRKKSVTL
jgi:hypothetical protein